MAQLVSIIEIAHNAGLELKKTYNPNTFRTHCVFCGDDRKHYHLYLSAEKDTFYCQRCKEKGGATMFYALLHNVSFEQAKETLYPTKTADKPKRKRHPAESLSPAQLQEIGFASTPRRKPNHMTDSQWYVYRKNTLDFIWKTWQEHIEHKQQFERYLMSIFESQQNNQTNSTHTVV